jgi:hypothetical protein
VTEQTPVEMATRTLTRVHWDGTGCGTHGTSACTNCFGPSPMSAHEVVRDVFASIDVEGLARVLDEHEDIGGDAWYACRCGWPGHIRASGDEFHAHQAHAMGAWLRGDS